MNFFTSKVSRIAAGTLAATAVVAGSATPAMASSADWPSRWWDPSNVIESPVNPDHAEGALNNVSFTNESDGSHTVKAKSGATVKVKADGTGFTPGQYYTVRAGLVKSTETSNIVVYTWQTYRATQDGKINIDLGIKSPNSIQPGEKVIGTVNVYNANDVRQDGRPQKVDSKCALMCERVAPLAAHSDFNDANSTISYN
ncbi:hypothetical protein [Corynebacterium sp. c7Ub_26]